MLWSVIWLSFHSIFFSALCCPSPSPSRISRRFFEHAVVDLTHLFSSISSICFATQCLKKYISGILRKKMGHEPTGPAPKPPNIWPPPTRDEHPALAADAEPLEVSSCKTLNSDGLFVFNSRFLRANHCNRSAFRLRYSFGRPYGTGLCLFHRRRAMRISRIAFPSVSSSRRPCRSRVDRRAR